MLLVVLVFVVLAMCVSVYFGNCVYLLTVRLCSWYLNCCVCLLMCLLLVVVWFLVVCGFSGAVFGVCCGALVLGVRVLVFWCYCLVGFWVLLCCV